VTFEDHALMALRQRRWNSSREAHHPRGAHRLARVFVEHASSVDHLRLKHGLTPRSGDQGEGRVGQG